ncbi:hypothetical protein Q1695_002507 [Nippostrongylus brasiliensis]|nr:hypothetical protein Q1695_002507 [Nippostrongylus brasiliensis]
MDDEGSWKSRGTESGRRRKKEEEELAGEELLLLSLLLEAIFDMLSQRTLVQTLIVLIVSAVISAQRHSDTNLPYLAAVKKWYSWNEAPEEIQKKWYEWNDAPKPVKRSLQPERKFGYVLQRIHNR